jgi:hypothetical protein
MVKRHRGRDVISSGSPAKRDHRYQQHDVPGDCPRSAPRPWGSLDAAATPAAKSTDSHPWALERAVRRRFAFKVAKTQHDPGLLRGQC